MGWTFPTHRPYFLDVIESWYEQHRQACERVKERDWPALKAAESEFEDFINAIDDLHDSDDPLSLLRPIPAAIGMRYPEMRQLSSGGWRVYYAISEAEQLVVGLVVLRVDAAEKILVQMLDDAR